MAASVLLHVCCAHCAAYCIKHWRALSYDVTCYWYNPNIHPQQEYEHRLEAMRTLAASLEVPLLISDKYDSVKYFQSVPGRPGPRCLHCFRLRLGHVAEVAKRRGLDAFTTTLVISPQQKHDLIREVGEMIARSAGVSFLYADLRRRYSDSRHITKRMDIYRQQYCGCIYSEWERYVGEELS
ncbi:MAG: epoxyqueuosine reductase QueH [Chloroflexi bacterium]|nr:epoxyqueuosine reductase QueH [Chloroflexota bacterium]